MWPMATIILGAKTPEKRFVEDSSILPFPHQKRRNVIIQNSGPEEQPSNPEYSWLSNCAAMPDKPKNRHYR